MTTTATAPKIVGPRDGKAGFLGSIGVRFMIDGHEAADRFSLVEHPLGPRALAAPVHRHHREDEYSYVLEGRMGALLGDDVVEAGPGDLVHKPRGQWHTFSNAGDEPARILEIISPRRLRAVLRRARAARGQRRTRPRGVRRALRPLRPGHAPRDPARALRPLRSLVPWRRVAPLTACWSRPNGPQATTPPPSARIRTLSAGPSRLRSTRVS